MAYNLELMIDDFNGAAFASAGEAEWGYIAPSWFLALPTLIPQKALGDLPADIAVDGGWGTDVDKNDFTKAFMKANYHKVRGNVGSDAEAYFIAAFRTHIMARGAVVALASRGVKEDEYSMTPPLNGAWNDAANTIPNLPSAPAINRWIKRYGSCIIHSVAYMFVSRGHHYKQEYLDKYNKLFDAQFLDRNPGFQLPSPDILYRQALHCFGVKPLIMITLGDFANGRMAAAMSIRWNPHAPVSGVAKITTMQAALDEMMKEKWWAAFEQKFRNDITAIGDEVALIRATPYEYHVASVVVTGRPRKMLRPQADRAFNHLCQFALGFIDYLGRRHSLSGQMAITQKSGGAGPLADGFSRACSKFSKAGPTDTQNDMTAYLQAL